MKPLFKLIRHLRLAAIPLALILCLLPLAPAYATEFRSGNSVVIPSGQTIEGDLYATAGSVVIDGNVTGDLLAAAGTITINGTINGSVMAAGGEIVVNGRVGRSVRATGGRMSIGGAVGGDVVILGGEMSILRQATVTGQMMSSGGTATVDGTVNGGIGGNYGNLTIGGNVRNGVNVEVGQLRVLSTARIDGGITYRSDTQAVIEPGAQVTGQIIQQPSTVDRGQPVAALIVLAIIWRIILFFMTLLAGIVFILLLPRLATVFADTVHDWPLPSLGWGALLAVAAPILFIVLLVTVIGIPLALILLALYLAALWFGQVFVALFIGEWILNRFRRVTGRGWMILAFLLGLIIVTILVSIPFLGGLVSLVVSVVGLGALWLGSARWISGERPETVG